MNDPYAQLIAVQTNVTKELCALHALPATLATSPAARAGAPQVLATIGFGGPDMKGALGVLADDALWTAIAGPVF